MQVIVPLIVTVVDLKEQVAAAHRASIRSGTLSAAAAAAGTQYVTAAECREVMPKGNQAHLRLDSEGGMLSWSVYAAFTEQLCV